jgi:hypothetical protein
MAIWWGPMSDNAPITRGIAEGWTWRPRSPVVVIALWQHATRRLCRHRELVRVHVKNVWYFECACGYRVPIMTRAGADPHAG